MVEGITIIDKNIDLVHDTDNGGYYFQEFKMDGKGTTRVSVIYSTRFMAEQAYEKCYIKWKKWD